MASTVITLSLSSSRFHFAIILISISCTQCAQFYRTLGNANPSSFPTKKQFSLYGETCDAGHDCAPFLGLTCFNSTCFCARQFIARLSPDKTLKTQTTCVVRADLKCSSEQFNLLSGENVVSQVGQTSKRSFVYFWSKLKQNIPFFEDSSSHSNCVDNARCIDGVCKCAPDYFKDFRGLCLKKRTLFQPCEEDANCRASEGLICKQDKCQCKTSMIFDRAARKCLIPVGSECDAYSSEIDMECVRNSECTNDRCVCISGFTPSLDGTCGVAHGQSCTKEKFCSEPQLTCRSGVCQCKYVIHQMYNETLGVCQSRPDGPCIPEDQDNSQEPSRASNTSSMSMAPFAATLYSNKSQACIPFSHCVKTDNQTSMFAHVCKCDEGYGENQQGDCVPSYLSSCEDDDDCDHISRLTCINGKCSCPDDMLVFDWGRRKCLGMPGTRCKLIQLERFLAMRADIPTECVDNAVCVENNPILDGRCRCKDGYTFSKIFSKCL